MGWLTHSTSNFSYKRGIIQMERMDRNGGAVLIDKEQHKVSALLTHCKLKRNSETSFLERKRVDWFNREAPLELSIGAILYVDLISPGGDTQRRSCHIRNFSKKEFVKEIKTFLTKSVLRNPKITPVFQQYFGKNIKWSLALSLVCQFFVISTGSLDIDLNFF